MVTACRVVLRVIVRSRLAHGRVLPKMVAPPAVRVVPREAGLPEGCAGEAPVEILDAPRNGPKGVGEAAPFPFAPVLQGEKAAVVRVALPEPPIAGDDRAEPGARLALDLPVAVTGEEEPHHAEPLGETCAL